MSRQLAPHAEHYLAIEPVAALLGPLNDAVATLSHATAQEGFLGDTDADVGCDTYVLVNVLEHIEDDVAVLRDMFDRLADNGAVVLFVPAFPALFSDFDRRIGHRRRSTRKSMRRVLEQAGFTVELVRHVNLPGACLWWLGVRTLGLEPGASRATRIFDRLVVPWVQRLEARVPPPFGQSILAVGRKVSRHAG
jgi:hypothetical protein